MNMLDHRLMELNQALVELADSQTVRTYEYQIESTNDSIQINETRYDCEKPQYSLGFSKDDLMDTTLVSEDYSCTNDDYYIGVKSTGPTTITLPLNPTDGMMIIIKAEMPSPISGKKITITSGDGSLIDDDVNYTITAAHGVVRLIYRGGNWHGI